MSDASISPPSLEQIETIAQWQLDRIPNELRRHVEGVVIRIADFPDDETMDTMGLETPFDLLGLYHGVAIGNKSISDPAPGVDMIFLYRRALLEYWCASGEDLGHIIRHVLIHEIGHHFGLSDADMERIEEDN
ncbi:MAG: acetylglutamate kinase [Rhodospirillaceae bacterium]|jgi:predicted Zn-dependent protease with MMP-like domain|nr:acetylglutamate kinase [Rhodospirillaceae bacterium]MBT7487035.1 acetylglutamate kinase [Rhodospirillales bacterium]MBT4702516.1 acetylglutamate kinase [Rhodospirillaceae bacterium]MBT5036816.1 acetylglutamate kinase [Rhodospirillaceae bacterium]MBT6219120.1 acetylglutamate kinase [Rhodospirillaceae bacterium]